MADSGATFDPLGSVQRVAVADESASLLRHELRNKFASVRSAEFYIRRRLRTSEAWNADPRLEELSGIIQEEMRLASELLDRRHLQHVFTPAAARVDAADCVRHAAACTRRSKDCHVEIEVEAEAGHVLADPSELALATRCLLENAVEALGTNGLVRVRARPEALRYVIRIEDTGAGVSKSQHDALFEPFFTTKPGHAGLGLKIARRIAERYAGILQFCESPQGTVVALELELIE
jgi:signal transduction histidine kinase